MAPDRDSLQPDAQQGEPEPEPEPEDGYDHLDPDDEPGDDELPEFADEAEGGSQTALPGKVESWRKRSATGAVLTGIALGLQQVFDKEREEPAIIQTTSGDPPRDLPVEADVEHGRPRRSVVSIRPWLLDRSGGGSGAKQAGGSAGPAAPDQAIDREPPTGSMPEGD